MGRSHCFGTRKHWNVKRVLPYVLSPQFFSNENRHKTFLFSCVALFYDLRSAIRANIHVAKVQSLPCTQRIDTNV